MGGFRRGDVRVLVATDIASRGIDVADVSCVVNMELPLETESYVHRIGRTARAGESGQAVSFVTAEERGQLKAVARFIRTTIPVDGSHPFKPASRPGQPPQNGGCGANFGSAKARKDRRRDGRKSFAGRRQPDFGQRKK